MVVEQTLVDGDAQVPDVDHLGGRNVDLVDLDFALTVGSHGEFVKNLLGGLVDTEDHDLVDDLSGGFGVEVLVSNRLGHGEVGAIVVVTHLSSLVESVVVVLTIIKIKVTAGLRVDAHGVSVDLKADGVVDSLEERLSLFSEVEDGEDSTTADVSALLLVTDMLDEDIVVSVDLDLSVDIVPLRGRWQVDLNLGGSAGDGVLDGWDTNLG